MMTSSTTTTSPDLSTLSPAQLKSLKSSLLTEHFRFAPESFAKGGMDLANAAMYAATAKVESSLQRLVDEKVEGWGDQEELVQRGIYRLETLLEHSIDENFDLFEIYVLRNIFTFDNSLIPYMSLPHQANLDPNLQNTDVEALSTYEQELKLYEEELEKRKKLKAVELFMREKEKRMDRIREEIGWLSSGDRTPLSNRSNNLSPSFSQLHDNLSTLLATAPPPLSQPSTRSSSSKGKSKAGDIEMGGGDTELLGPWAESRSSFVNWVAGKKAGSVVRSGGVNAAGAGTEGGDEGATAGTKQDAKDLLAKLS